MVKTPLSVIVMLIKRGDDGDKILLQRRQNTGFCDGLLDMSCSGHVEEGETFTLAAVREAREELGITIKFEDLTPVCTLHKCDKEANLTYVKVFMTCHRFDGEPTIFERNKCSELNWFDIKHLPKSQLIDENLKVLDAIGEGKSYLEYGWEEKRI